MTHSQPLPPEAVLAHTDWVHRLARSLVQDVNVAADLGQDTLVQALQQPPVDPEGLRGWLATAARNLARRHHRGEERRKRRERFGGPGLAADSAVDVAQRAELQRALVDSVLALDEPYREVILRRYLDGLTIAELATRTGRPSNTVRSQLVRGLRQLRSEWQGRPGGRSLGALSPLAALAETGTTDLPPRSDLGASESMVRGAGSSVGIAASLGTPAMRLAFAVFGLTLSGWAVRSWIGADEESPVTLPTPGATPALLSSVAPGAPDPTRSFLAAASSEPSGALSTAPLPSPLSDERALVVDVRGSALPHFALRGRTVEGLEWTGASDEAGCLPARPFLAVSSLRAVDAEWLLIARGEIANGGERGRQVFVAAPAVSLRGRVRQWNDTPIAGARVEVSVMREALLELPYRLTGGERFQTWVTYSSGRGHFALERVPSVEGFDLKSWGDGWKETAIAVPPTSRDDLELVLRRGTSGAEPPRSIEGRVVDERGRGLANVSVDFGFESTRSGADGSFQLRFLGRVQGWPLTAVVRGRQPAVVPGLGERFERGEQDIRDVRLVVGGEALSIRGRVLDVQGEPRVGVEVFLRDGTGFGSWGHPLEFEASGTSGVCLQTGADGAFEFGGLWPRDYWIVACDSDDMLYLEARSVKPGTHDLELREPADAFTTLRGLVRSSAGRPLDGVTVALEALVLDTGFSGMMSSGREVTTDADGRFAFEAAPWRGLSFLILADDVVETRIAIADLDLGAPIELTVPLRHRLKLRWADGGAEAVAVLDEGGLPIPITLFTSDGSSTRELVRRAEFPRGGRCEVDESARSIAGYRDGSELWRRGIQFERGVEVELDG